MKASRAKLDWVRGEERRNFNADNLVQSWSDFVFASRGSRIDRQFTDGDACEDVAPFPATTGFRRAYPSFLPNARRFLTIRIRAKLCIYRVFQKDVNSCETSFSPHWASSPSNACSLPSISNDSAQNAKGRVKRNRAGRVKAARRFRRPKSLRRTNGHSSSGERHQPQAEGVGATRRLKLRGGTSVWMSHVRRLPRVALAARDFRVDCLIVGSGISGALAAHALIQSGLSVAMIDRRSPLTGSTLACAYSATTSSPAFAWRFISSRDAAERSPRGGSSSKPPR